MLDLLSHPAGRFAATPGTGHAGTGRSGEARCCAVCKKGFRPHLYSLHKPNSPFFEVGGISRGKALLAPRLNNKRLESVSRPMPKYPISVNR